MILKKWIYQRSLKKSGAIYGFFAEYIVGLLATFIGMLFYGMEINRVGIFLLPIPLGCIMSLIGWDSPRTMAFLALIIAFFPLP